MKPKVQTLDPKRVQHHLAWVLRGVCVALLLAPVTAPAQTLSDQALAQIRFDQKLNTQVSLTLPFLDENGQAVRLGQYFGHKPVLLVLGYYKCPMLCTLVLNGLLESAADMKWTMGREFEVIDVSIDPHETPALAAAKQRTYLKRYGRPEATQGWHFLTGTDSSIGQLTSEVGFRFAYDQTSKQYAHPSGLIILTPEGKVSGYLFGVSYPSKDLYESLLRASTRQVSSPIQQIILLCFHYNPLTGKYSGIIMICLRCFALATLLGMVWALVAMARRNNAPGILCGANPQKTVGHSDPVPAPSQASKNVASLASSASEPSPPL